LFVLAVPLQTLSIKRRREERGGEGTEKRRGEERREEERRGEERRGQRREEANWGEVRRGHNNIKADHG